MNKSDFELLTDIRIAEAQMDQVLLVDSRINAGDALMNALATEGIQVTHACWIQAAGDEGLYLYLATPLVDKKGLPAAYRRVHPIVRKLGTPWIDPFEVKLISPRDPIATAIDEWRQRYPTSLATRFDGSQLGGLTIDWAYVYPPPQQSAP